jgi:hypothetical protein
LKIVRDFWRWLPGLVENPNFHETNLPAKAENGVRHFDGFQR